jgi:hypothetical protein
MQHDQNDGAWFAPKRYGIGTGLPVAWQGWALLVAYIGALVGLRLLAHSGTGGGRAAALALFLLVTGLFLVVVAKRTRGGLRWRWGSKG